LPLTLADRPPSPWSADASSLPSVRRRARAADRDRDAPKINRPADPIWKARSNELYEDKSRGTRLAWIPVSREEGSPSAESETSGCWQDRLPRAGHVAEAAFQ